jgi:hypothetical protein
MRIRTGTLLRCTAIRTCLISIIGTGIKRLRGQDSMHQGNLIIA